MTSDTSVNVTTETVSDTPYPNFQESISTYVIIVYLLILPFAVLLLHVLWNRYQHCWDDAIDNQSSKKEDIYIEKGDQAPILSPHKTPAAVKKEDFDNTKTPSPSTTRVLEAEVKPSFHRNS